MIALSRGRDTRVYERPHELSLLFNYYIDVQRQFARRFRPCIMGC
jgi:hypothetical protein